MADNAQKTPFVESLKQFTTQAAESFQQLLGKAVPASITAIDETGTIVTVQFEVKSVYTLPPVTCPLMGSEYIRFPLKVGDKGMVVPSDLYLGGMSGLGDGVADLTPQANLGAVVFMPFGNKKLTPTDDDKAVVIYGENGVVLRTADSSVRLVVDNEGINFYSDNGLDGSITKDGINLNFKGNFIQINADGINIDGTATGGTTIDGHTFLPHTHDNVQPGSGNSGPVTP